ncbi:hypothetical protein UCREL1_4867 [Eutypa lata UCREL1]|uniref:RNase H type-1 domain-containing protein n=1 Tax=Eutypa lata (strain UCR-EL1) TaxID=1287681 RepID=M7SV54_EUTLA|nr:hypothetical protein UCREL1_4867 [Eutypa lata UCREL1]
MAEVFQPEQYVPDYEDASDVEHPHMETHWVHPKQPGSELGYAEDTIIVSIATDLVHDDEAHGVGGFYYGPGNAWNSTAHCTHQDRVSLQWISMLVSNRMLKEIALIKGPCNQVCAHTHIPSGRLRRVIIKTDSDFLAEFMTRVGMIWLRRNNYITSYGEPLQARLFLAQIVSLIEALKADGIDVLFWHVSEEENVEARQKLEEALFTPSCH